MLKGKVAIVTGANRGIGLVIAQTFVANGAQVFACMRTLEATSVATITGTAASNLVVPILFDLSDEVSIKAGIKEIRSLTPRVDVLVNNAGVASGSLFQMTPLAEIRRLFEINFFGQILFSQSISRLMASRKSGSIINISSSAGAIATPGTLAYGASKVAFERAALSMACELGALGIRVNTIAPGVTKTDMYDQMSLEARDQLIARAVFKRPAEPKSIADAALFFASDLSAFVTGQVLRVDGGLI